MLQHASSVVSPGRRHRANHRALFRSVSHVATQPLHNQRSPGELSSSRQSVVRLNAQGLYSGRPNLYPCARRLTRRPFSCPDHRSGAYFSGTSRDQLVLTSLMSSLCPHAGLVRRTRAGTTNFRVPRGLLTAKGSVPPY